jgi:hypothetical protein
MISRTVAGLSDTVIVRRMAFYRALISALLVRGVLLGEAGVSPGSGELPLRF